MISHLSVRPPGYLVYGALPSPTSPKAQEQASPRLIIRIRAVRSSRCDILGFLSYFLRSFCLLHSPFAQNMCKDFANNMRLALPMAQFSVQC